MKFETLLVSEINRMMMRHGYTMASSAGPVDMDALVMRFVVADGGALAERLRPIVIKIGGLEFLTAGDAKSLARHKVNDAMAEATGQR